MSLSRQIRQVLAELELISFGATQAWNASGGHSGEPDDRVVSLVIRSEKPPYMIHRERFATATTDHERETLLEQAVAELASIKVRGARAAAPKADRDVLRDRILEEGKGWNAEDVARSLRCSVRFVNKVRADDEHDQAVANATRPSSRAAWAASLAEEGLSQQAIAERMSTSQANVSRLLKAHRTKRAAA